MPYKPDTRTRWLFWRNARRPNPIRRLSGRAVARVLALTIGAAISGASTSFAASFPASEAQAQELRFFRIGTGSTGSTDFAIGGLIANAISKPPGSRPCEKGGSCGVPGLVAVAQASSGAVDNIELLRNTRLEAALVQADVAFWAYAGQGPYKTQPSYPKLRAIANLFPETVHVVVRADSDLTAISQLRGRVVGLGEEGSGTLVEARMILEAYGLGPDDIGPRYYRPGQAADRLAAGEIDAFFFVGGLPVAVISDLAQRLPVRLLPMDDLDPEWLKTSLRFLIPTNIAGNIYSGVPPVRTMSVSALLVVRDDLSEDLIYRTTAALWHDGTHRLLTDGHPRGRSISFANALRQLSVPLHPGAERFYQETGLLGTAASPARSESAILGTSATEIKPPHTSRFRPPLPDLLP